MAPDSTPLHDADLPFLDLAGEPYRQDPWRTIAELRASDPRGGSLFRSTRGTEVVAYDLMIPVLRDRRLEVQSAAHWVESGGGPLLVQFMTEGKMTSLRGEKHLSLRRMVNTPFQPGPIEAQRELYRDIANELVDAFADRSECDLVADFAHKYPIIVLCRAIGVPPEDIALFEQATLDLALTHVVPLAPVADRIERALQTLWDYSAELLARRERDPADDFVTELAQKKQAGVLTQAELVWGLVNLLFAGHDSTRWQMASIARVLLEVDAWAEVAEDPSLAPAAVEEGMRFHPVPLAFTRVAIEPGVVLDGVELPLGALVRLNMLGTMRDPARFSDPHRFDLHRETPGHIAFGHGLHKCVGHAMARTDMEVALEVLTGRLERPRISGPVATKSTGALWGVEQLPVRFDAVRGPLVGVG